MGNPAKLLRLYGVLMIVFLLSCEPPPCEDFFYEVTAVELIPRKVDQPTIGHALWRNEDQLPTGSLVFRLEMFKPIQSGGGAMSDECRPKFINTNPAIGLKLISNKDFNSKYPAGSNLIENISFSLFDSRKISEKAFLESQFNQTNWNYYYLGFKNLPDTKDLHSLILSVSLSDGAELKSPATEVLLTP